MTRLSRGAAGTSPATPRPGHLLILVALALGIAWLPLVEHPIVTAHAGAPTAQTFTFNYTGEPVVWSVPADVHALSATVTGAAGGGLSDPRLVAPGGRSGTLLGDFRVPPGEPLTIWVGGAGDPPSEGGQGSGGFQGWGYTCGGFGGQKGFGGASYAGGGGGGSSAITIGAFTLSDKDDCTTTRPATDPAVLVSGGGGGGGGSSRLVVPDQHHITPGGSGGEGDLHPTAGQGTGGGDGPGGGCAGCETGNGRNGYECSSSDPSCGGGGAGGGGQRSGGGGSQQNAGGGGGGSFSGPGVTDVIDLPGTGDGNGQIILSTTVFIGFSCADPQGSAFVPAGVSAMDVTAAGGNGGSLSPADGGLGGAGGRVDASVSVAPGQEVDVHAGCNGTGDGGSGYGRGGAHGTAPSGLACSGEGGGGSSGVTVEGVLEVLAAGGGAGGGNASASLKACNGNGAGFGGQGGFPALPKGQGCCGAAWGSDGSGSRGYGECGGCMQGSNGVRGHNGEQEGGGGGGGGAGLASGNGGAGGTHVLDAGGGGGGGGGLSGTFDQVFKDRFTPSPFPNGLVELVFETGGPAHIAVHGGNAQNTRVGENFAQVLEALVTDSDGRPLPGVPVTFQLQVGPTGAEGTFNDTPDSTTQTLPTGTDGVARSSPIFANFVAGGWTAVAFFNAFSNAEFVLGNTPAQTIVELRLPPGQVQPGETVEFTAIPVPVGMSGGPPTGNVEFRLNGDLLPAPNPVPVNDDGLAIKTSPPLAAGTYTVTALYAPVPRNWEPSTGFVTFTVGTLPTATTVTSSANPSLPSEAVTFTADVSVPADEPAYNGAVQFALDGAPFGPEALVTNGQAVSEPITPPGGAHAITAAASETEQYEASVGTLSQVVDATATAVHVTSSARLPEYGAPLQFTAAVSSRSSTGTPTGAVVFQLGDQGSCTGQLVMPGPTASCTPDFFLPPGRYDVTAAYSGDATFAPSTGAMTQRVARARTATTVTSSTGGSSTFGEAVTFTAHVARVHPPGVPPSGTVQFALDGEPIGPPVLPGPSGFISPAVTPAGGAHRVTATFSGEGRFGDSIGAMHQVVRRAVSAITTLTPSVGPTSRGGDEVTFTAQVTSPTAAATGVGDAAISEGVVQFRADGTAIGSPVPVVNGVATSPGIDVLIWGPHNIAAVYTSPAGSHFDSVAAIVHGIDEVTATSVATDVNRRPGTPLRLLAYSGPRGPGGTTSFVVDGIAVAGCQDLPVEAGLAECAGPALSPGIHEIRASYSGDTYFTPSEGSLLVELVGAPATPGVARPATPVRSQPNFTS